MGKEYQRLQERGALLTERGVIIGEAMDEENFLTSWLTEEGKVKKERKNNGEGQRN